MKPSIKPVLTEIESLQPEAQEQPLPTPRKARAPLVISLLNFVLLMGACAFLVKTYQASQQSMQDERRSIETQLEQLRVDVVTTSSENVVYLKTMLLKPGIDKLLARDIAHSIALRAREHHRDPDLVLALIAVESNFNPNAVSPTGALGLTQIMPVWKTSLGIDRDLRDIDTSIKYGLDILGTYEQMFGSMELALTAYNRGPRAVTTDMEIGKVPFNGYAENILHTYARIKAWMRP